MYKPHTRSLITVIIAMVMILSALFAMFPNAAATTASGTVTYSPTIVTPLQLSSPGAFSPVMVASGGSFTGVTNFYFYWSTTNSVTGLLNVTASKAPAYAFSYSPQAGATTFSNALLVPNTKFSNTTMQPGATLYLLASTSNALTTKTTNIPLMGSVPFTVSQYSPAITIENIYTGSFGNSNTPVSVPASSYVLIQGSGFGPSSSSAAIYIDNNGTNIEIGTVSLVSGSVAANQYVQLPDNLPYGDYAVFAVDNTFGETAGAGVLLTEQITVSPLSISGSQTSTFTINGFGFPANSVIKPYSSVSTAVTVGPSQAVQTGVTIGSNGEFTLQVTGLNPAITTPGGQTISIKFVQTNGNTVTVSFPDAIYVSIPGQTPFFSVIDLNTGTSFGFAGDSMEILGGDFPASQSGTVFFDGITYNFVTDSNGFFELVGSQYTVPNLPAGKFTVEANVVGITASAQFFIGGQQSILDSAFNNLNGEYASVGSTVYVVLMGLAPYTPIDVTDTGLATEYSFSGGDLGFANHYLNIVTVNNGSFNPVTNYFYANGNGYLNISYKITYASSFAGVVTQDEFSITVINENTGNGIASANYFVASTLYDMFFGAGLTSDGVGHGSATPGSVYSLTFNDVLVPLGAPTTPEGAGFAGPYSVYFDNTLMTLTSGKTTFTADSSGSASVSFVVPKSASYGVHTITVYGASTTSGSGSTSQPIYMNPEFIVSQSGKGATVVTNSFYTSVLGGTGTFSSPFQFYSNGSGVWDIEFDLYNFPAGARVELNIYSSTGLSIVPVSIDSNGAGSYFFYPGEDVGMISYMINFTATYAGSAVPINSNLWYYETVPVVAYDAAPFGDNGFAPATDWLSYTGSNNTAGMTGFSVYAYSLLPNTEYNIFLSSSTTVGNVVLATFETDAYGSGSFSGMLPFWVQSGKYYLDVAPATASPNAVASLYLTMEVSQNGFAYAFPGMMSPQIGWIVSPPAGTSYYIVTVMMNGSAMETLDVTPVFYGYGSGGGLFYNQRNVRSETVTPEYAVSFSYPMPNGQPGNYWYFSYELTPVITTEVTHSIASSSTGSSADSWAVPAPGGTFTENGVATFNFPSGTTAVNPTGIDVTLGQSSGAITSSNNGIIVGASFASGVETVEYSITFTLLDAKTPTVTISATGATLSYTATTTAHDGSSFEIGPQGSYTESGTATFVVSRTITVSSVSSYALSLSLSSGTARVSSVTPGTISPQSGTVTFPYTVTFTVSGDASTSPVLATAVTGGLVTYSGSDTLTSTDFNVTSFATTSGKTYTKNVSLEFTGVSGTVSGATTLVIDVTGSAYYTTYELQGFTNYTQVGTNLYANFTISFTASGKFFNLTGGFITYTFSGATASAADTSSWNLEPQNGYSGSSWVGLPVIAGSTGITVSKFTENFKLTSGGDLAGSSIISTIDSFGNLYSPTVVNYSASWTVSSVPTDNNQGITISPVPYALITYSATSPGTSTSSWNLVTSGEFTQSGSATFSIGQKATSVSSLALTLAITSGNVNISSIVITSWEQRGSALTVDFGISYFLSGTPSGSVTVTSAMVDYTYNNTSYGMTLGEPVTLFTGGPTTLISGNGAYIMGISSSQIATVVAAVSSTVTTSMQVPLSELNASIVAIKNASAVIKTAVGTMTASLSAINASVTGVSNGIATIETDVGTLQASLASINATISSVNGQMVMLNTSIGTLQTSIANLNASLASINGGIATLQTGIGNIKIALSSLNASVTAVSNGIASLNTSVGKMQASLNAINAQLVAVNGSIATLQTSIGTITTSLASINAEVTSINGNTATIKTDLGTISGTVTSISNGTATIQTKLGTLQASVNGIQTNVTSITSGTTNTLIFEVIILILVLVTLVLAFMSMNNSNKLAKKLEEQKKQ